MPHRRHFLADRDGRARHAPAGERHADETRLLLLPLLRDRGMYKYDDDKEVSAKRCVVSNVC